MTRQCGDCQLCCKLLPMKAGAVRDKFPMLASLIELPPGTLDDFHKPAGVRCPHQRHHKGCMVYDKRPIGCRVWVCRWLAGDDTADLRRPDRAGYVIDSSPDFIRITHPDRGEASLPVVQIWVDEGHRDAWQTDPDLRDYIERRAREGIAVLIRYSAHEAATVFAPVLASDGEWHCIDGDIDPAHRTRGQQ